MWNAALLIDNYREDIESYVRLLEFCSYIWLSAFLFRSYLVKELDQISKPKLPDSFGNTINKRDNTEELISKINKLRIRSIYIQQIKYQSLLSLWDNADVIFEKILENAWQTDKTLYSKIGEQAELLNSIYQYLHDKKQNKLNSKINNGLSFLQVISIPLALLFTLLTWSDDSSICGYLKLNCEVNHDFILPIIIAFGLSIPISIYVYIKHLKFN
jgi:hypothetical protein